MCQYADIQYNSPFVGLFFYADDYIRLLTDLDVIYKPFVFIQRDESRYKDILSKKMYPIGLWPDENIEIHFLHYKSEQECVEKWTRRLSRFDKNNLVVKFCDKDQCCKEHIEKFDSLSFDHKVCFTTKPYPKLKSVVWLKEQKKYNEVDFCWQISDKYWNFVVKANALKHIETPLCHRVLLWLSARIKI